MARTEARLGATSSLGTTYTNLFTGTSAHTYNVLLNVTNRAATAAELQAFIAANSWSSGEPTGGDLVAAVAYGTTIQPGEVYQVGGFIMSGTEKLIVRSDTATSLDVVASGVDIT